MRQLLERAEQLDGPAGLVIPTQNQSAAAGSEIIRRRFNANLFNNGLSPDGRFAACHTCNSYVPNDSATLAVFDLSAPREVAHWKAESGWPNLYEFSEDGKTLGLGYKGRG